MYSNMLKVKCSLSMTLLSTGKRLCWVFVLVTVWKCRGTRKEDALLTFPVIMTKPLKKK